LAKRFYYVYFCTAEFELKCSKRLCKKINETANLVHLPGCNITSCKNDKYGNLMEVTLDTYATVRCNSIFMQGNREPDLYYISNKFISLNENKAIIVGDYNNSLKLPGIYVVGNCSADYKKSAVPKMCEQIINNLTK
jgi:thioredoxin reductase